jgi:hypothetical protein
MRKADSTPRTTPRTTWRRQAALDRVYAEAGPPGSVAPSAVGWAREAGLEPDPAAVAAALDAEGVFAEDVLFQLLAALGVLDLPTGDGF